MTPTDTPIAAMENASKRYGGVQALAHVSFSIARGEVRALLGKNGAGKSTVIRLLSGVEAPDEGTVSLGGRRLERPNVQLAQQLGVRTVYQELSLIPYMTVAENLFMGVWPKRRGQIDHRAMVAESEASLHRLGLRLDPRRPVSELSIADQQMVEIARALSEEPTLLILDEPTSSLGAGEVDRVLNAVNTIKSSGVAVIYVSHRLAEIRRVADSATIMRDGRVISTLPMAGTSTREVVEMMVGDTSLEAALVTAKPETGPVAMTVRAIRLEPKLEDVTFDVRAGEVLGIAGVLGSGRTELLQVMAGLRSPDAGEVELNGERIDGRGLIHAKRSGIGLTPEDRKNDGIFPELGVDENLVITDWGRVSNAGVISPSRLRAATRHAIDTMSVRVRNPKTPIGHLSGGNQQKVVIGRWLHAGSRVLLLDEPTRGVDVHAKAQIYELVRELATSGASVVFVSSEMDELNLVCDRAVVLAAGRIVAEQTAPDIETDTLLLAAVGEHDTKGL
ncbi:MAG: sugar transport system ATP-binding protein [Frankiales bacterium]|jgi:simple sugar transport system ATP-binding protein|nr:sugar transport system ATP-binding protein [Frankiales bacterium]